jgi:hypothetical protein
MYLRGSITHRRLRIFVDVVVLALKVRPSTREFFVTMSSCVRWAHSAGKVIRFAIHATRGAILILAVQPEEANVVWPGRFKCHSDGTAVRA